MPLSGSVRIMELTFRLRPTIALLAFLPLGGAVANDPIDDPDGNNQDPNSGNPILWTGNW